MQYLPNRYQPGTSRSLSDRRRSQRETKEGSRPRTSLKGKKIRTSTGSAPSRQDPNLRLPVPLPGARLFDEAPGAILKTNHALIGFNSRLVEQGLGIQGKADGLQMTESILGKIDGGAVLEQF